MTHDARTPRKVGYTHMAFYRGWLQGLPLRDMADAYLETGMDLRLARSTVRWIQDTLRQAALRHGRRGEARLLRVRIQDVRHMATPLPAAPTIDEFRDEFDPGNFYTYDELLRQYLERYPDEVGDRKTKRRAALIERQLHALTWIEDLLTTAPVPNDPVRAWFDPGVATRLEGAGIERLDDLMAAMRQHGYRWYRRVPQVGERRAKRLLKWLTDYQDSLGCVPEYAKIEPKNLTARQTARSLTSVKPAGERAAANTGGESADQSPTIVPFEAMLVPRQPAPAAGAWPGAARACHIPAQNDKEAIQAWLDAKAGSPATGRAYRKEAERFLLWTIIERSTDFRSLDVADCTAYRDWLATLGRVDDDAWQYRVPQDKWFAPRYTKRYSPAWRPFEGALSIRSVRYALTVCASMFAWLSKVGYLAFDPWDAVGKAQAVDDRAPDIELTRSLSADQWKTLIGAAACIEDDNRRRDARLLLRLAFVTGMRLSEIAFARTEHVYAKPMRDAGTRWMLKIRGKGGRWRSAPLTDDVLRLLREQLRSFGLPDDPRAAPEGTAIIMSQTGDPMTSSGVSKRFDALFTLAGKAAIERGLTEQARVFSHASAHWLRHTTGATLGNNNVPPSQIQQLLGHVSIATTSIYTDTGQDELFKSVNRVLGASR